MEFVTITITWYTWLLLGFWVCLPSLVIFTLSEVFLFMPRYNKVTQENDKLEKENKYLKELTKYKRIDIKV